MRTFLKAQGFGMIALVLSLCLAVDISLAYLMGAPNGPPIVMLFNTPFNATQLGMVAVALYLFLWKAFGPMHIRASLADGRRLVAVGGMVLLAFALIFSISVELSFYKETIHNQTLWASQTKIDHSERLERMRALEAKSLAGVKARSVTTIEADRTAELSRRVGNKSLGEDSRNCTDRTAWSFRMCDRYNQLGIELATARDAAQAKAELDQLRTIEVKSGPTVDLTALGNAVASIFGGSKETYIFGLAVIIMASLQIGAMLLPTIVFHGGPKSTRATPEPEPKPAKALEPVEAPAEQTETPPVARTLKLVVANSAPAQRAALPDRTAGKRASPIDRARAQSRASDRVRAFIDAQIIAGAEHSTSIDELYSAWCKTQPETKIDVQAFSRLLGQVLTQSGISHARTRRLNGRTAAAWIDGIALRSERRAA